jgi:hypothetical protein
MSTKKKNDHSGRLSLFDQVKTTRFTLDIPTALHKSMKIRAIHLEITLKEYILNLVRKDMGV